MGFSPKIGSVVGDAGNSFSADSYKLSAEKLIDYPLSIVLCL
jgi:hypothetical protein